MVNSKYLENLLFLCYGNSVQVYKVNTIEHVNGDVSEWSNVPLC